jgi:hypothetical protein
MLFVFLFLSSAVFADYVPEVHPLFDGDAVHEIRITIDDPNWHDTLSYNYETFGDSLYTEATFECGEYFFETIGVRFKGNSSYNSYPGLKKSFKLDINEFVSGQKIDGIDKFNLNNIFKDPSYVREICHWEIYRDLNQPYLRFNYANVYVNDELLGLYLLGETINSEFLESRFGPGENGTMFKGDPHGSLQWFGSDETAYYEHYELENNEEDADWASLVKLLDVINNTPTESLADSLFEYVDVNSVMAMLAVNNFTVSLDSYNGSGHNFFFYKRESDNRFHFIPWDQNESWGCFNQGLNIVQLERLNPLWLSYPAQGRPLAYRLWYPSLPYRDIFRSHIQTMMYGTGDPDTVIARMEELRDMIRPYVYAEPNKMYSDYDFDNAMILHNSSGPGGTAPALDYFIRNRHAYLESTLGSIEIVDGLILNELMSVNNSTIADEFGEFDDWVELTNTSADPIDLDGLYLTDNMALPTQFTFPDTTIQPGDYMIVWCDEDTLQGPLHSAFKLASDGETVYLMDGSMIVDQVTYGPLSNDISYGLWEDNWQILSAATPGAENENPESPGSEALVINEFMAKNNNGIQDEMGSYEDWVEIWNPGETTVQLGGIFLTDDLSQTTKWSFPDTSIAPGDFLVIWCDDDTGDGPLHTNFKLGASGEELGLFDSLAADNVEIDSYVFGAQSADVSEGREFDGGETWVFFNDSTPGESNGSDVSDVPIATQLKLHPVYPNPFNPSTTIKFELPESGHARLEVFDTRGRRIALLLDEQCVAGISSVTWNGIDSNGKQVASGHYLARISSGGVKLVNRMVLAK